MIEVAPELLKTVRRRQRVGVIAEVVLAELASAVAEIQQKPGERRRARLQIRWGAWDLRKDHARSQGIHSGEKGTTPRRAALLGIVVREHCAFVSDAVDVG